MALIPCPKCGAKFDVSSFTPGKKLRCAKCKEVFAVPSASEAVPAAAAKQGDTRTSIKKRPSEAVKAVAPDKKSGSSVRASSRIGKPAPAEEEPLPAAAVPGAPPSKKKLIVVGVAVVVLGGGAIFFGMPSDDAPASDTETYDQHVKRMKGKAEDASLALWCVLHKDDHAQQHVDAAAGANPKAEALVDAVTVLYWGKRLATPADDVEKRLDLAEWCDKYGLTGYKNREAERALALDPKNDRAKKIHEAAAAASASSGGGGGGGGDDFGEAERQKQKEADDKELAKRNDWQKASYKRFMQLRQFGPIGKETDAKGFTFFEAPPFTFYVESSEKYKAEDAAKEMSTALQGLWNAFKKEIADKLKLEKLDAHPIYVHVFNTRARCEENARSQSKTMLSDAFLTNYMDDVYLWTFYEGKVNAPGLWRAGSTALYRVASAAKGGGNDPRFWLSEGLGLCFEAAAKAGKDTLGGVDPERVALVQEELKLERDKRKTLGFSTLVQKTTNEIVSDLGRGVTTDEQRAEAKKKSAVLQAEAATLCAYLLSGDLRPKLEDFLDKELSGKAKTETFAENFGGVEALEEAWEKFVQGAK